MIANLHAVDLKKNMGTKRKKQEKALSLHRCRDTMLAIWAAVKPTDVANQALNTNIACIQYPFIK